MNTARIVIIEDQLIPAFDMRRQLNDMGYKVTGVFTTAEEALKFLDDKVGSDLFPEVIITDISLAGDMDGLEAASIIKDKYDSVVIISTGVVNLKLINETLAMKPAFFILKPFDSYITHITVQMGIYQQRLEKENKELKEKLRQLTNQ